MGNRKHFHVLKVGILAFFLVLSSFMMSQKAFAEGDGTGGGKAEGLMLVSSSINDGAVGVPVKPEIKLTFSKNIVNMTVNENNKKCFSIQNSAGGIVPINVIFADDQIDFAGRNDAIITPKANLSQAETYHLIISENLKSKSGVATGKEIRITFTTEGTKPSVDSSASAQTTAKSSAPVPKVETQQPAANNTNQVQVNTSAPVANAAETKTETQTQTETSESNTGSEQQTNTDIQETVPSQTNLESEKPTPYEAAETINTKNNIENQSSEKNIFLPAVGISFIVILAAVIIYIYKKKKRAV
ncbi:Ig-like domain-containing protein [Neobacillus muris]|uniref:Ig-like domain-containing protein n=1 Tax=Neobacillus muris TaxID=2941334 RepID=UPI002040E967|nr:Ig-like domain-containing protein [Neobacillus muris]